MMKLIVGCGYLGGRVARRWLAAREPVAAVTRSAERAGELEQQGIRPIVADVARPNTLKDLPPADAVLYSVGYDRRGQASRQEVYVDGLRAVLDALAPETARVIFISSTGVYGHSDGRWIDEESACRPIGEGGRAKLAAEEALAAHRLGDRAIVLRLAGVYGPGRIPRLAELLAGKPVAVPQRGHLNLIHVEDAAAVVVAAASRAQPPRTYVVSDGCPTRRRTFYEHLADLLEAPRPQFVEPPPDAANALRAASDKRASNARMLAELGVVLAYPSYREGLAAVAAAEGGPNAGRRAGGR